MRTKLVIVALIFASGASLAGDLKVVMRPVTSFGYLDTDKDSRITPKEAEADWAVVKSFEQADTNHDGYLNKEEFAALSKG
jgi:hypothetical protein